MKPDNVYYELVAKMCSYVGADPAEIDTEKQGWSSEH